MKILVVTSMPIELKTVKEWIKSVRLKTNLDVDYLCCGIWNYEAISSLERYLSKNPESIFIWNIWVCAYWNTKNEKKSEIFQVSSVINIHTEKEMIIPPFLQVAPLKTCLCSENVIKEKPEFRKNFSSTSNEMYFDMESWWIEFIASKYKYPCLILKVPFDFIWDEILSFIDKNFKENVSRICELLWNLSYNDYLGKILNWIQING